MASKVPACLSTAHGVEHLRGGGGRCADEVERVAAPVGRHLAATAGWIGACADGLQEHILGCDPERHAQPAIAIVREEPVVAGAQGQSGAYLERFMACTGDLEEYLLLSLEKNLTVVDVTREKHEPVDIDKLLWGQPARGGIARCQASSRNCKSHFPSLLDYRSTNVSHFRL